MDKAKIRAINKAAIEEARKSMAGVTVTSSDNDLMWALVAAVVVYVAIHYQKPEFVMKKNEETGVMEMCQMRAVGTSAAAGVVLYLVMGMMK